MRLPDFAASAATRQFCADLNLEHLEEASFLHEQRTSLYDDPEVTWLGIGRFEERFAAHLEALIGGGNAAVELCTRTAEEGDPGQLYTAVCVFCRSGRRDLLGAILKRLDFENLLRVRAVRDAITDYMPPEWGQVLAKSLSRGYDKLTPLVAHYVGYRRVDSGAALEDLISGPPPTNGLAELLWACGRVGTDAAVSRVAGYVDHQDAAVRANAVMALMRRGDPEAAALCSARASSGDAAMCLPLAVSGGRSDSLALQRSLLKHALGCEAVIALGVLGDLSAVRLLIDKLADEDVARAASTALQLITGADLREDAFIPETLAEDELFDDEREVMRQTGEGPKHPDGRPFGISVNRASRNPDEWRAWIEAHASEFVAGQRYRLGKPFSLGTLVDTLVSPLFRRQIRSLAYEELVVRYGIDLPFEADMRVQEQKKQINAIARECRARESSFQPGGWYFAGELIG
jgi:uncharacterized protein (TIGR02270 family)